MRSRRRFAWCLKAGRLPLLVLWLVFLSFFFYTIFNTSSPSSEQDENEYDTSRSHRKRILTEHERSAESQLLIMDSSDIKQSDTTVIAKPSELPAHLAASSTTRKSPTSEYSRQSGVFILIIQDEDRRSKRTSRHSEPAQQLYPSSASSSTMHSRGEIGAPHKLVLSDHIKIMIEILDYHRIDHTIGTTRFGLPEQLLLERANTRDKRRFSVIVIDDFVKYMQLNRWIRDQLDRYCSSNDIGVVTYALDNHKLDHNFDTLSHESNTSTSTKSIDSSGEVRTKLTTSGNFPLTFESIEQECKNESSRSCLVDYQISDRTNILRILKNKRNFVIRGELNGVAEPNVPLVAMSSNHITYEPLTWAKLRAPQSASGAGRSRRDSGRSPQSQLQAELTNARRRRQKRQQSGEWSPKPAALTNMVTQHTDRPLDGLATSLTRGHAQKRAVLPSPSEVTQEWLSGETDGESDDRMQSLADNSMADSAASPSDEAQAPAGAEQADVSPGDDQSSDSSALASPSAKRRVLSMVDRGLYDGIKRVIFGITNRHWTNRILLLDAIEHLSSGEIMTSLDRYVQIDIDDIFVGERGTRLKQADVEDLVQTQDNFARLFDGQFRFNLGFSGKYFKRGNEAEQAGDEALIRRADKFTWFCHFWSHSKAHLMNSSESLARELDNNLAFARDKNLTLIGHTPGHRYEPGRLPPTYAVAPHHSGVYPIHEELYENWCRLLNVQVTSTEEYPHLRPASSRRGFVHNNIRVLPRQVCGLYTHTIYRRKYPGGFNRLVASIRGGELFETLLHNPVNIYMTHMSNYANDRLAPYTFNELFKFVQEHTNLRLRYAPSGKVDGQIDDAGEQLGPLRLAEYYFDLYPGEREPLWTNPCQDRRHLAIWAPRKQHFCRVVPKILIVGPQKTGTTALHSFLKLNPHFKTSRPSADDFEEVQFFNDKHYALGPDWYFERFSTSAIASLTNTTKDELASESVELKEDFHEADGDIFYIDKSATYFDDHKAPSRASALLPRAIVIILLIDPADRAYSWYQHMRAHGDHIATELTFEEVLFEQEPGRLVRSAQRQRQRRRRRQWHDDKSITNKKPDADRRRQLIQGLRNRCIRPGYYSSHLSNWLQHYESRQIVIIDGQWFRYNPIAVLDRLQSLLRVPEPVDYSQLLAFDEQKGFFCERIQEAPLHNVTSSRRHRSGRAQTNCLGSGKGRKYEPMSSRARAWLNNHYLSHNRQLAKLLYEIGQPLPRWLDQSLSPLPVTTAL